MPRLIRKRLKHYANQGEFCIHLYENPTVVKHASQESKALCYSEEIQDLLFTKIKIMVRSSLLNPFTFGAFYESN